MSIKLAVVGSRTFDNVSLLRETLLLYNPSVIITGGAKGADTLAEEYARLNHIPLKVIKPDWSKYGKAAGVKRNQQIIESADECVAFWDGTSKGTLSSIKLCEKFNVPCNIVLI